MSTVRDLMQREVVTAAPETTVREVAHLLADRGISGMPVATPSGEVLGVVSSSDLVRLAAERPLDQLAVSEIMTPVSFSVGPDCSVRDLADFLVRGGIHRAMVLEDGRLLGIVTTMDVLAALADGRL